MDILNWASKMVGTLAAKRRRERDPVWQVATTVSKDIFARLDLAAWADPEARYVMAGQMAARISAIVDAQDRIAECRKHLHECVCEFSRYQVLNIPPAPAEDVTGLRGLQGISGELEQHVPEIVRRDDYLRKSVLNQLSDANEDAIRKLVILLYQRGYWFAHTLNAARVALGDCSCDPSQDWYRPFLHAMCVWDESKYRKLLNMEPAIPGDDLQIVAMAYLGFANIVRSAAADPLATWRLELKELFDNGTLSA